MKNENDLNNSEDEYKIILNSKLVLDKKYYKCKKSLTDKNINNLKFKEITNSISSKSIKYDTYNLKKESNDIYSNYKSKELNEKSNYKHTNMINVDNVSDSMLNCDDARMYKLINKNSTLPIKKQSSFENEIVNYIEENEYVLNLDSNAQRVIKNLNGDNLSKRIRTANNLSLSCIVKNNNTNDLMHYLKTQNYGSSINHKLKLRKSHNDINLNINLLDSNNLENLKNNNSKFNTKSLYRDNSIKFNKYKNNNLFDTTNINNKSLTFNNNFNSFDNLFYYNNMSKTHRYLPIRHNNFFTYKDKNLCFSLISNNSKKTRSESLHKTKFLINTILFDFDNNLRNITKTEYEKNSFILNKTNNFANKESNNKENKSIVLLNTSGNYNSNNSNKKNSSSSCTSKEDNNKNNKYDFHTSNNNIDNPDFKAKRKSTHKKFNTVKHDSINTNEGKLISTDSIHEINVAEYLFNLGNKENTNYNINKNVFNLANNNSIYEENNEGEFTQNEIILNNYNDVSIDNKSNYNININNIYNSTSTNLINTNNISKDYTKNSHNKNKNIDANINSNYNSEDPLNIKDKLLKIGGSNNNLNTNFLSAYYNSKSSQNLGSASNSNRSSVCNLPSNNSSFKISPSSKNKDINDKNIDEFVNNSISNCEYNNNSNFTFNIIKPNNNLEKNINFKPLNSNSILNNISIDKNFVLYYLNNLSYITKFLDIIKLFSKEQLFRLIDIVKDMFCHIIAFKDGLFFFCNLYNFLNNNSENKIYLYTNILLEGCDYINSSFSKENNNLLEIIAYVNKNFIFKENTDNTSSKYKSIIQDNEVIYSVYNKEVVWMNLIPHRYGKNTVEFFLSCFFINAREKHQLLFEVLLNKFIEYSMMNYSTFVIQKFVQIYKTKECFFKIIENINKLTSNRNGIFVIISGLKSYKGDDLNKLLDKIMHVSEFLCKNMYASTLMEYVFNNHTAYSAKIFINEKLNYLLGKY